MADKYIREKSNAEDKRLKVKRDLHNKNMSELRSTVLGQYSDLCREKKDIRMQELIEGKKIVQQDQQAAHEYNNHKYMHKKAI